MDGTGKSKVLQEVLADLKSTPTPVVTNISYVGKVDVQGDVGLYNPIQSTIEVIV